MVISYILWFFFFFNDTATTEIYTYWHTLSLHDALPIYAEPHSTGTNEKFSVPLRISFLSVAASGSLPSRYASMMSRSEEHTSELQSLMRISYAVFCLKKKKKKTADT